MPPPSCTAWTSPPSCHRIIDRSVRPARSPSSPLHGMNGSSAPLQTSFGPAAISCCRRFIEASYLHHLEDPMRFLVRASIALIAAGVMTAADAAAQARGIIGLGLSAPVGDFADESGGDAQAGGGTALLGVEWMPAGQRFGLRVDGAYNRFCTSACEQDGGDLDVRYRFLNG